MTQVARLPWVLIVERDPTVQRHLRAILHDANIAHDVVYAASAKEALEYLGNGLTFDVILVNLRLPDQNGAVFMSAVRMAGKTVPAVLYSEKESRRLFIPPKIDVAAFLVQDHPAFPTVLAGVVRGILNDATNEPT